MGPAERAHAFVEEPASDAAGMEGVETWEGSNEIGGLKRVKMLEFGVQVQIFCKLVKVDGVLSQALSLGFGVEI